MDSKLESVQYSAVLAITGTIKGTSKLKLCKELKKTFWCLYPFYEIMSTDLPTDLFNLIPKSTKRY